MLPLAVVKPALPPGATLVLGVAMALFGVYLVHEFWRWKAGNRGGLVLGQFRRRMTTGLLLEFDLLLWILADPLMLHRPARERLLYLLFATLLVFIPMLMAVREVGFIMRQYARSRSEMVSNLGQGSRKGDNGSAP